ncbi:MAG: redoxin family protein [Caulobacteraceae bacterium]|nr:redoxin family protein [Caulobacteraceae bacterium]
MRLIAFVPLVALLALVGVSVFLLTREGERERFTEGMVGQPAPAYALARLDDGPVLTNDERRGRAYVINLFASWCTPCRAEHPQLMALRAQGVDIVGIAYKDRPEASRRFLNELGDPFADVASIPRALWSGARHHRRAGDLRDRPRTARSARPIAGR